MNAAKEEHNEGGIPEVGRSRLTDLFTRQQGRLKCVIAGMGFGPADADDILQEVCLRVVKQPAEYRSDNEATQWLVKVTMNLCLLEHRQRQRFEKKTSEILLRKQNQATNDSTEQTLTKNEELKAVREAMREMDGTILAALTLRYFAGLNSTEVGETLGINASTVRSRLREGRMILAEKLLRRGVGPR